MSDTETIINTFIEECSGWIETGKVLTKIERRLKRNGTFPYPNFPIGPEIDSLDIIIVSNIPIVREVSFKISHLTYTMEDKYPDIELNTHYIGLKTASQLPIEDYTIHNIPRITYTSPIPDLV